jgi:hypothetical protein
VRQQVEEVAQQLREMAASSLAGVDAAEFAKTQAVTAAAQRALDEAIVAHATASSAAAASRYASVRQQILNVISVLKNAVLLERMLLKAIGA